MASTFIVLFVILVLALGILRSTSADIKSTRERLDVATDDIARLRHYLSEEREVWRSCDQCAPRLRVITNNRVVSHRSPAVVRAAADAGITFAREPSTKPAGEG